VGNNVLCLMASADANPLTATAVTARLKLAEQSLAPFEAVHRDLLAIWGTLETKAQGATAIAGVFLGATISILTRNPDGLNSLQQTLIVVIAGFLAAAVVLALLALTPRPVPLVNDPEHRFRRIRDLLALKDDAEFLSLLPDFYTDEREQWAETISAFSKITITKAKLLYGSHLATALAIIAAVALVKSILFP
jgi:hypothetical protein